MIKVITSILLLFIFTQSFGQPERKISTYLFAQYNKTIYDITTGNNPWGIGLGLQALFNNQTKFKPAIELTGDIYLEDDKNLRLSNNKPVEGVPGMVNFLIGSSFQFAQIAYLSLLAGPCFINSQTRFSLKPSFGFYFSRNQKYTGKISYINVFNRNKETKDDFGSVSFALGLKLF